MKNIGGVAFLILVTAHLGTAWDLGFFFTFIVPFGYDFISRFSKESIVETCPGLCMPLTIKHMCALVNNDAECPNGRVCCVFSLRIDLNLLNVTEFTPIKVSQLAAIVPEDTTLKDIATFNEDDMITTDMPLTSYEATEVLELENEKIIIEEKNYVQDNISCSGVCIESHLTKYCEAYISSTDLCRSGKLCCVSISSYGDSLPSDLVLPYGTKRSTEQPTTPSSTTSNPEQLSSGRECTGECLSGLSMLFCDAVDGDAICPSEGTCCLKPITTTTTTSLPITTP